MTRVTQPEPVFDDRGATLADRAYLRLREEIIRVELLPGTLLRDEELMARIGIGRTPVREAVQRLHSDGFVTILPRRGTLVSRDQHHRSGRDLRGAHAPRVLGLAAGRRAGHGGGSRRDPGARRRAHGGLGRRRLRALLDVDRRMHRFVYRCAKNAYLARTLDLYHDLSLRILYIAMKRYPSLTPRLEDVVHEQRTVLEAIGRGDAETAERVAVAHIAKFERAIRQVI